MEIMKYFIQINISLFCTLNFSIVEYISHRLARLSSMQYLYFFFSLLLLLFSLLLLLLLYLVSIRTSLLNLNIYKHLRFYGMYYEYKHLAYICWSIGFLSTIHSINWEMVGCVVYISISQELLSIIKFRMK